MIADLILRNGRVRTEHGEAEALAVLDGVIIALGGDAAVTALRGPQTKVHDLEGATVLPGLHDLHVHPMSVGLQQLTWARIPVGADAETLQAALKQVVGTRPEGKWVTGGQWNAATLGVDALHRRTLDAVSPRHPVLLSDISGHSAWANSCALRLARLSASTPDPPGGRIERDEHGEPTGVLREAAVGLVRAIVPQPSHDDNVAALAHTMQRMLSLGITSFADAGAELATLQAYAALADRGELKQRVRAHVMIGGPARDPDAEAAVDETMRLRLCFERERLQIDAVKIVLDGVPTDGHTAAMVDPYCDSHEDDPRSHGLLQIPQDQLERMVVEFDRLGLLVKFHSAGDAAVRAGLDAIEAARVANGHSGLRHEVGHNSFIQLADIARARAIGATFEMSPYIWYPHPIIAAIEQAVGPERMARWMPVRELLEAHDSVVLGSDSDALDVRTLNPWVALETLVTRRAPGGGIESVAAPQAISLEQAFDLLTVNAARQMGNAHRTGSTRVGWLADLVVVDRDPFEVAVTDIHRTVVLATLVGGEFVFER